MNRAERRRQAQSAREQAARKPRVRAMLLWEKIMWGAAGLIVSSLAFFIIAATLSPVLTGRCLRCYVTNKKDCRFLKGGARRRHRHALQQRAVSHPFRWAKALPRETGKAPAGHVIIRVHEPRFVRS